MATKKMGRPIDPEARRHAVILRMNDGEKALLDAVLADMNRELAEKHLKVRAPDVLRSLVSKEADARGLRPEETTSRKKKRGG